MSGEVQYPSNWSPYALKNFAGGLNVGDAETQGNQLREAMNVELPTKNGAIQNRKGYRNMLVNDVGGIPTPVIDGSLEVTTQQPTSVAETTATGNGTIVNLGMSNPTAHGVCWLPSTLSNIYAHTSGNSSYNDKTIIDNDKEYLYVFGSNNNVGCDIYKLTDPESPTYITNFTYNPYQTQSITIGAIKGDYLYVCDYSYLITINISNREAPVVVRRDYARLNGSSYSISNTYSEMVIRGNYLYYNTRGICIWDISTQSLPVEAGNQTSVSTRACTGITVSEDGNTVYLISYQSSTSGTNGLHIYNATDKTNITHTSYLPMASPHRCDIDMETNVVYIGGQHYNGDVDSEINIVNVSDSSSSSIISEIDLSGEETTCIYFDKANKLLYFLDSRHYLHLYSVSDNTNPVFISKVDTGYSHTQACLYEEENLFYKAGRSPASPSGYTIFGFRNSIPTIDDDHTDEGSTSAIGAFTSAITGLTEDTLYSIRAYATNIFSTAYGETKYFTTETPE